MHSLLERQLRKLGLDPLNATLDAAAWEQLRDRISRTYADADQERYLLERSLNLASAEMRDLYEQVREDAETRYLNLFESANDIIFTIDDQGRFTSLNRAFEELSGHPRDTLIGRPWSELFAGSGDVTPASFLQADQDDFSARFEADILAADGQRIPVEISSRLVRGSGASPELLGVGRDVRERRFHESHLEYVALHDMLTGLANRQSLESSLAAAIAETAIDERGVSVLALLDLDEFKMINDTLGHAAGDQVLTTIATLLRAALPGAVIARLSGDEFAFLLHTRFTTEALQAAERVRQAIADANIRTGDERVYTTASIGLVRIDAASHPAALLAEADAAMYRAKDEGRNRIHWSAHQDTITGRIAEVYRWATILRVALAEGRVEVHYQPIVNLNRESAGHYEALIRLRSSDGELVTAATFLPAADRLGLMPDVDRFVVEGALAQLRRTPQASIFVNLSAGTLADRHLLSYLLTTLRQEPALGRRLGFEITESAALRDIGLAQEWIHELTRIGCAFALDDFGTGFNSLAQVRQLPVSLLKIDGSFVRSIADDPKQRAVVAAVQVLADRLGMETVAECIETQQELDIVRALGVTYGQGYLLGRPAADIPSVVRAAA